MRPDSLILTSAGFYVVQWDPDKQDFTREKFDLSFPEILESWNVTMEIDEMVSLHHLFSVLRRMDASTRIAVEALTNSNLGEFLEESAKIFPAGMEDADLHCVEIYRNIEVSNWFDVNRKEYESHINCHALGKPWSGPEMEDIPLEKRGNSYAIEFTPWYKLRNLPLVLRKKAAVTLTTWEESAEEKVLIRDNDGSPLLSFNKEIVATTHEEWATSFTLGEFFQGLFDEIAFFGSPENRDARNWELNNILDEKLNEKEEPKPMCPPGKCVFGSAGQCVHCGAHRPAPHR